MKRKIIVLSILICAAMVGGGFLARATGSFWIGFALFLAVFLGVMIFGCGPWIDKVSVSMVRTIKKDNFSEAIRIGEEEKKGTATIAIGIKINLAAAYFQNKDIEKARTILEGIDIGALSWTEKRVFDNWKKKIDEFEAHHT
jgi:hypothetical protein